MKDGNRQVEQIQEEGVHFSLPLPMTTRTTAALNACTLLDFENCYSWSCLEQGIGRTSWKQDMRETLILVTAGSQGGTRGSFTSFIDPTGI